MSLFGNHAKQCQEILDQMCKKDDINATKNEYGIYKIGNQPGGPGIGRIGRMHPSVRHLQAQLLFFAQVRIVTQFGFAAFPFFFFGIEMAWLIAKPFGFWGFEKNYTHVDILLGAKIRNFKGDGNFLLFGCQREGVQRQPGAGHAEWKPAETGRPKEAPGDARIDTVCPVPAIAEHPAPPGGDTPAFL